MAAKTVLQPVAETGWRSGFSNLFRKEMGLWFGTSRWWKHLLRWTLILNGIIVMVMMASRTEPSPVTETPFSMGVQVFFKLVAIFTVVGAALSAQDAIIGERQSGTAAWILSKPVARAAFVLSKFVAHALSMTVITIIAQCAVFVLQMKYWSGQWPAAVPFAAGIGMVVLNLLYYQALCLMLSTIYQGRGAVAGTALGVMFAGQVAPNFLPWTAYIMPWMLGDFAAAQVAGMPLPAWAPYPMVITPVLTVVFLGVALWRFEREEM